MLGNWKIAMLLWLLTIAIVAEGWAQDNSNHEPQEAEKKILTLEECIQIALVNNIQLKQVRNNARISKANDFQAIMNFLPSLSGFGNYQWDNGTSFDNSSGQFFTGSRQSSFLQASTSLVLFNGMSNVYSKQATARALVSNTNQIKAQEQILQSSVLGSYLSVILDKENMKISQDRIDLLGTQMKREEKRESVGVGDMEQVYNFKSQLANEKLRLVNLKNQLLTDMLSLLQNLQLEVTPNYDIAPYQFDQDVDLLERDLYIEVLEESMLYSPGLKSAEANAEASHFNMKATQASMAPTVTLNGSYSTQYSSLNKDLTTNPPTELTIGDQYKNLNNKNVEVRMTIPIFNNYQNRTNTQVAKLNLENAKLNIEQAQLEITNTVQRVYLDLINAQETYKAAQENMTALNQSYEFVKTRYDHGNTDFYTYLESLNNKNRAEIELVNAKYSIIFRKKILDVFRGLL